MTTATGREHRSRTQLGESIGFVALMRLNIGVSRYWPGSIGATIATYLFLSWASIWLVSRIRAGYLRRRPCWTRDSWLRYLRLAAVTASANDKRATDVWRFASSTAHYGRGVAKTR